jgi:hypothetical protein
MHLQFKATENFRGYNDPEGLKLRDGNITEIEAQKGKKLLKDFPKNFFKVTVEEIEADPESGEVIEEKPVVEAAPNKMVTERKPYGQKRKGRK